MSSAIKIENLYKEYRLGTIGYGTLREDIQSWWANILNKQDPNSILNRDNINKNQHKDRILALDNVNLDIKRGESIGIIGNNGAGKTTLLKILAQITSPSKGRVSVKGRIASLIALGTGFHKELTGRENVYLNGCILGLTKQEIDLKFDRIIEFSGVGEFINTPVKRYSTGMNIRLGFAVAAFLEPDILIVDEILAVGDAAFRIKALNKMTSDREDQGRTILFVSHNMVSLSNLCQRTIVLDKGQITFDGKTEKAIKFYLNNSNIVVSDDINRIKLRDGFGRIKFSKVEITDETQIQTGNEFRVQLYYEILDKNIQLTKIALSIWKADGTRLIFLNTLMSNKILSNNNKSIECIMPNLPLVEGQYKLNVAVHSNEGIEDVITGYQSFYVHPSNYYGTGITTDPEWGSIVLEHEWR